MQPPQGGLVRFSAASGASANLGNFVPGREQVGTKLSVDPEGVPST